MVKLFSYLTTALESNIIIAVLAAFIWGILSILLSPCHLASVPLIVGYVGGQQQLSSRKAFYLSLFFASGIIITIGLIGLLTGIAGRMLGDIGTIGNKIVAVVFVIIGLYLLELLPLHFLTNINQPQYQSKTFFAPFILGLLFGLGVGPCTFAYMAPMLGIVFKLAATQLMLGVILILFYALGHCSIIVFAGTFTESVQKYLNWSEYSKGTKIIKTVCGILVILSGVYLFLKY